MGTKERRERERQERRRAILEAARSLVRKHGFNGTTTKMIAARCELSEATLFFYFSSKDEILTSLLLEGAEFMATGLENIVAGGGNPRDKLRRAWKFFAAVQTEHPEYIHVSAFLAHPQATAAVDETVRDQLAKVSGENFARMSTLMAAAVGREEARVGADVMWAAFLGLMLLRDARVNLGLPAHPDHRDLGQAFETLSRGMVSQEATQRQ